MLGRLKNNRGDTIVEVMIVLAVLGLAIGISYSTANRSLLNARQAQENSRATELARSQVEWLVSLTCPSGDGNCADPNIPSSPSYRFFHGPFPFCIDASAHAQDSSNAACTVEGLYNIQVRYFNTASQPHTFEVQIIWDDVLGEGTDTVRMDYTVPS